MSRTWVIVSVWIVVACGGGRAASGAPSTTATNQSEDVAAGGPLVTAAQGWARRADADEAKRAAALWTEHVTANPDDAAIWLRLAEAHHFAATAPSAESGTPIEQAKAGLAAAEQALRLLDDDALSELHDDADALTNAELVPALYWRARHQYLLATHDYTERLLTTAEIVQAMRVCERLRPDYDHFGAVVFLAQSLAQPLDPTQRDLPAARRMFERALTASPNHAPHQVAFAEYFAVAAQDRALFERQLQAVLAVSTSESDPTGEQQRAQTRARVLLDQVNERFE